MVVRSVPFLGKKNIFGSIQNRGPRQPNHYERSPFAHATPQQQRVGPQLVSTAIYSGVHLHQTRPTDARSVRLFGPRKEQKRDKDALSFQEKLFFSRAAWNLFDFGNQPVPTHLANIPFGSFQCSLVGGKTRPNSSRYASYGHGTCVPLE